jgi:hypothetical protein
MRRRRHVLPGAVLAAALLLASSSRASAQQSPSEFESGNMPGWTFTPGVVASTIYDDNVGLSANFPTEPPPQGDLLFVIEPSGQLEFVGPHTNFSSGYRGYLRRYSDLEQLNGYDQRGYATLRHGFSRQLSIFASDTFMKVPSTDELQLNGVPFSRTGSRNNNFATGLESRPTRRTDLNVRYELTWVDFDATPALLLRSGLFHGVQTDMFRRLNGRASLGGEYSIRFAKLDNGLHSLTFQNAGVSFHYDSGPRTKIHAAAGVAYLIDRLLNESHIGPYVRADIEHHMERANVGAGFTRDFVPTFGFGGSSQSESFHAFVTMPVYRNRIYMQQSVSWRRTDPLIVISPALNTWWLHSTVGYGVTRWMRAEGYYAFTRQDSNIPGGLIHRNRIGAQIIVAQPMRIP